MLKSFKDLLSFPGTGGAAGDEAGGLDLLLLELLETWSADLLVEVLLQVLQRSLKAALYTQHLSPS